MIVGSVKNLCLQPKFTSHNNVEDYIKFNKMGKTKIYTLASIFLLLLVFSCQKKHDSLELYREINKFGDVSISEATNVGEKIILFADSNRVFVLDQKLNIRKIESTSFKPRFIETYHDSLFISKYPGNYFFAQVFENRISIDTTKSYHYSYFKTDPSFLFEDDKYSMYECCHGEFGGTLFIKPKNTKNIEYGLEATCPQQVLSSKKGEYYILNDLRHMRGSSSIIKIDSIQNLIKIDSTKEKYCNYFSDYFYDEDGFDPFRYDSLTSVMLGAGNKYIVDSVGLHLLHGYIDSTDNLMVMYISNGSVYRATAGQYGLKGMSKVYNVPKSEYTYARKFDMIDCKIIITEDMMYDKLSKKEINLSTTVLRVDNSNNQIDGITLK